MVGPPPEEIILRVAAFLLGNKPHGKDITRKIQTHYRCIQYRRKGVILWTELHGS
jgi:hypothetical protein